MKTWTIIFTSVVAAILVAGGLLFFARGQIQKWETAEAKAIAEIDQAILYSRRESFEHGANMIYSRIQLAGFTLRAAPLWADEVPLRNKCMEGGAIVNRYRESLGLPPYTLGEMLGTR